MAILREAVINAIVHADYSQRGAPIRVVFLDDRIEIENPGILLPGLTIKDMKQGVSRIRNQVLARTFRELNFIEQWGTGIRRIFKEADKQGLPEPEITEIGMRVRVTIYLAEPLPVQPVKHSLTNETHELSDTEQQILRACSKGPLSSAQLLDALGYKARTGNFKKALSNLLQKKFRAMTLPDTPRSKKQKYRVNIKLYVRLAFAVAINYRKQSS